jgi:glucose/mannose transport system substrate-binding protein
MPVIRRLALPALLIGALGCGARAPGGGPPTPRAQRRVELVTWWDRVGDVDALGALTREHRRLDAGAVVIHANTDLSALNRRGLRNRMLRSDPPDVFQADAGSDLLQWVRFNGKDARESKLLPLDDLVAGLPALRAQLPPAVLALVTLGKEDGKIYGVPANIHRTNELFFNRKVLERYGLDVPKSPEDLTRMGDRLRGTGVPLLALGGRDPWLLSSIVFECLLVSREGAATYLDYLGGKLEPDDERVLAALEASLDLLASVDPAHEKLTWLQAAEQVAEGRAAMTIMGDWARQAFMARGLEPGRDYGEVAFPGAGTAFVFTSDVFALPVAAENAAGARRLLATIASPEGQRAVGDTSGVLPARRDVALSAVDPDLQARTNLLRTGVLVPALSTLVPGVFASDLASALSEMVRRHDVEPVVHTLRSRYALLK